MSSQEDDIVARHDSETFKAAGSCSQCGEPAEFTYWWSEGVFTMRGEARCSYHGERIEGYFAEEKRVQVKFVESSEELDRLLEMKNTWYRQDFTDDRASRHRSTADPARTDQGTSGRATVMSWKKRRDPRT
ncbi:MAG: hypothetical protein AABY22_33350, partial [Nanoarchaeota archaeon]